MPGPNDRASAPGPAGPGNRRVGQIDHDAARFSMERAESAQRRPRPRPCGVGPCASRAAPWENGHRRRHRRAGTPPPAGTGPARPALVAAFSSSSAPVGPRAAPFVAWEVARDHERCFGRRPCARASGAATPPRSGAGWNRVARRSSRSPAAARLAVGRPLLRARRTASPRTSSTAARARALSVMVCRGPPASATAGPARSATFRSACSAPQAAPSPSSARSSRRRRHRPHVRHDSPPDPAADPVDRPPVSCWCFLLPVGL